MTRALEVIALLALFRLAIAALLRVSHDGSGWLLIRSLSPFLVGGVLAALMIAIEGRSPKG